MGSMISSKLVTLTKSLSSIYPELENSDYTLLCMLKFSMGLCVFFSDFFAENVIQSYYILCVCKQVLKRLVFVIVNIFVF